MSFQLGVKVVKRLVTEQDAFAFYKAKLSASLFDSEFEQGVFTYVNEHVKKHHVLPQLVTLETEFPELKEVDAPEVASYYVEKLENRYYYGLINGSNLDSHAILKANPDDVTKAVARMRETINVITYQQYRAKILDFGKEGPKLLLGTYNKTLVSTNLSAVFGWSHMDDHDGCSPGEMASIVGRMAMGKTFAVLNVALANWKANRNTLFVSMEMAILPIAQRAGSMYAGVSLTQLRKGKYEGFSSHTLGRFKQGLVAIAKEGAKFYIVDGNLAASVEDIYILAQQLDCDVVIVDGAYLTRHPTIRDRYQRIAENAELMKKFTGELMLPTIASWQFNREAAKKQKGKGKATGDKVGLEDIGGSDVIPQVSGIVLGLFEEDGVETIQSRLIDVMKGRDGQVGKFRVKWNFDIMDFSQVKLNAPAEEQLSYI